MKPNLPRQFLWTDKQSMDDILRLDSVNKDYYSLFLKLNEEPFVSDVDELKVFNELYYQLTRMVYEHPVPFDIYKIHADMKCNLGWGSLADIVMSMLASMVLLICENKQHGSAEVEEAFSEPFIEALKKYVNLSKYWKVFDICYKNLLEKKKFVKYRFRPHPIEAEKIKGTFVYWKDVTRNYDLDCIEQTIRIWYSDEDRSIIAGLIMANMDFYSFKSDDPIYNLKLNKISNKYLNSSTGMCAEPSLCEYNEVEYNIKDLIKEKEGYKKYIEKLESENKRLKALLEKKKRTGSARKFTLVQIVDYCKGCVEWEDAKSIVAMLNKLLRYDFTKADSKLVDSVETFFRNRFYGTTYVDHQEVFSGSIGNYKPNIRHQANQIGNLPLSQPDNKLLEE